MRAIQITIEEGLLKEVNQAAQQLGITRSAYIRDALRLTLQKQKVLLLEHKHQEGYLKNPVEPGEFDLWETEQEWGNG